MKASLALAILSMLTGLRGAYLWWQASRVDYRPFDEHGQQIPEHDIRAWIGALRRTVGLSGRLNKSGAAWTAIAVLAAGASALAAALSN